MKYNLSFLPPVLLLCTVLLTISGCGTSLTPLISVYTSSPEGDRLKRQNDIYFTALPGEYPVIKIDEDSIFQTIEGFGATFNEAGMICLNTLPPEEKEAVLENLFNPDTGAGFSIMKSPIAACDFASAGPWYSYNETPGDTVDGKFHY